MQVSSPGVCPGCDLEGAVGAPCSERACIKQGNHFVPAEYVHDRGDRLDPLVGSKVGDYLLVDVLGVGGFGKVLLALQLPILMRAALKLLHVDRRDPAMMQIKVQKFLGEAQALAQLMHPNIVRLLKYGVHDDAPYLVMEFVDGGTTLKDAVARRARRGEQLHTDDIRSILKQVIDGLAAAHAQAIVHRDIKPENIMLQAVSGNPNFVRILDFGLAKFIAERTETSMAMGTPVYMAPEQMTRRHIGPWTDLYAVGVMAFELMTGRRPFGGQTAQEIVATKLDPDYDPTSRLADLPVPDEVLAFFRRALAKDHAARFQTTGEFMAAANTALDAVQRDHTVGMESVDLTGLLTSDDLMRIELERERLAAERAQLAEERKALEALRSAPDVRTMEERAPWGLSQQVPMTATQTAPEAAAPQRSRRSWPIIAAVALLLGGGVAAAVGLSGGGEGADPRVETRVVSVTTTRGAAADTTATTDPDTAVGSSEDTAVAGVMADTTADDPGPDTTLAKAAPDTTAPTSTTDTAVAEGEADTAGPETLTPAQVAAKVRRYVAMGDTALKKKEWDKAGRYARTALKLSPNDQAAKKLLEAATDGHRLQARVDKLVAAGRQLLTNGDAKRALEVGERALKAMPGHLGAIQLVQAARLALKAPTQLSKSLVASLLRKATKYTEKRCGRLATADWTGRVHLTIQPTGSVTDVQVERKAGDTALTSCIVGAFRRYARFPKFNGQPMPVAYPVVVRGQGKPAVTTPPRAGRGASPEEPAPAPPPAAEPAPN